MNFMSYWNGAYNITGNSNLQYCDRGRFGSIVTKNVGDYALTDHDHDSTYLKLSGGTMTGSLEFCPNVTLTSSDTPDIKAHKIAILPDKSCTNFGFYITTPTQYNDTIIIGDIGYTYQNNFGSTSVIIGSHIMSENYSYQGECYDNVMIGYNVFDSANVQYDGDSASPTGSIHDNVIIGQSAGYKMNYDNSSGAECNVFVGSTTGCRIIGGYNTVCIGYAAGNNNRSYNFYSYNNTFIGTSSGIDIGSQLGVRNSVAIGNSARVTGSEQIQLGKSGTTLYAYSALNNRSDRRDKIDIRDTKLGLNFLLKHRPVEFRWDLREDYEERIEKKTIDPITKKENIEFETIVHDKDGTRAGKRFHEGFIAQEVEEIMKEMNVDFAGFQNHNISGGADRYTIGYTEYIPIIVKAIQELKEDYDKKIELLMRRIEKLEK